MSAGSNLSSKIIASLEEVLCGSISVEDYKSIIEDKKNQQDKFENSCKDKLEVMTVKLEICENEIKRLKELIDEIKKDIDTINNHIELVKDSISNLKIEHLHTRIEDLKENLYNLQSSTDSKSSHDGKSRSRRPNSYKFSPYKKSEN